MDEPRVAANVLLTLIGPSLDQDFVCILGDIACSLEVAGHGALFQTGNLTLASTCGGLASGQLSRLKPVPQQTNSSVARYDVEDFRSVSTSGLVALELCWTAEGPAHAVAVGELFFRGPNDAVTRTIVDGELLVVSAEWQRILASDEWVCLLKSCGQGIVNASTVCAQRTSASLVGSEDVFELGHVTADTGLAYRLCLCSAYSVRNCTDRWPTDFTVDVGGVTSLCGARQRRLDDVCQPCGPGHYKPADFMRNDCVLCPSGTVALGGSESCSQCRGAGVVDE